MKVYKRKWSDKEVLEWAEIYVSTCKTLNVLEQDLNVSHSTLWWNFMHRLPRLNSALYADVVEMIEIHKNMKESRV